MKLSLPIAGAAALAGVLAVLAKGGPAEAPRPTASRSAEVPFPPRVPPTPADSDLDTIRDIFHFGDEESPAAPAAVLPDRLPAAERLDAPANGPRLIGLVRRPDGLQAALALEGEVVLLGRGDSALGYTALDVSEERVIVRDPSGEECTLALGPI